MAAVRSWAAGLLLATAMASSALAQSGEPVELLADQMTYERDLGLVVARGNVEITQEGRILFADTVSYNQRDDVVTASGNVVLREPTGDVLYADHVQLTDNFKQGVVEELKVRLANNARMAARRATREGPNRTVLDRAVFTRCEACPEHPDRAPIWQIKANRVTRDLDKEIVEYDDAMVELFGVPVLYTPYFFHPDPTVDRKSGLLAPIFGSSGELGFQYTQPVYFVIDGQSDLTLAPRITSKEGVVMGGEYRQQFATGRWQTEGTITYVDQIDVQNLKTGDKELRGHIRSQGEFRLNEEFDWGFDFFRASDDTYLRRYDIAGGSTLRSTAFLNGFNGRHAASVEAFAFQGLRQNDKEGDTPIILPLANYDGSFAPRGAGGRLDVNMNAVAMQRTGGRDVRRTSFDGSWNRSLPGVLGGLLTGGLHLRGDAYHLSEAQDTDPTATFNDSLQGRLWPMMTLDWRLPMVRSAGRLSQFIEPRVQLVGSPAGGNPNDIPNEDSQSFEFTDANLFSRNRFTGFDRIESGSRVNYGITAALHGAGGGFTEMVAGQSLRINNNSAFSGGTGLEKRFSDMVGRVTIAPNQRFNYTFRYRVDVDSPRLDRHEHQLHLETSRLTFDAAYISLPRLVNGVAAGNTEEISFNSILKIDENWSLGNGYRGNFAGDGAIRLEGLLRYLDECFDFSVGAVRDFTSDRDAEASTSVFVRFRLKGLN